MVETPDVDDRKPWQRQPGEPAHWFARFRQYLDQEPRRAVLRVYRGYLERKGATRSGKKPLAAVESLPQGWAAARDKYRWRERADAYDREVDEERERRRTNARLEQEERKLAVAQLLYDKVRELLACPTVIREEEAIAENGTPQKIIMLAADPIVFRSAALLSREARNSARASLKMPLKVVENKIEGEQGSQEMLTYRPSVDGRGGLPNYPPGLLPASRPQRPFQNHPCLSYD